MFLTSRKQKTPTKTKEIHSKKNTKETQAPRKRRVAPLPHCGPRIAGFPDHARSEAIAASGDTLGQGTPPEYRCHVSTWGLDGSDGWFFSLTYSSDFYHVRDRKGTTKKLRDKDYAELRVNFLVRFASKPFVFWVMPLFRKLFGAVRTMFWLSGSFLAPDSSLNV